MSLSDYINTYRPQLSDYIVTFLDKKSSEPMPLPLWKDVIQKLQEFVPQGKLLRGILAIVAYEIFGGKKPQEALPIAAAVEFLQSALLIHDDIMDNDLTRRGKPTISNLYTKSAQGKTADPHFYGQAMGICVGDMSFFFAYELLTHVSVSRKMNQIFSPHLQYTAIAQMHDFHYGQTIDEPNKETIYRIYTYKTGHYTFSMPLRMGAALAGAEQSTLDILNTLGEKMGILFQIHDDYLGVFGDEKETGKPKGSDIRENKKTLIRYLLFENANTEERELLNSFFGKKNLNEKDIKIIFDLCKKYAIQNEIDEKIAILTEEVNNIIHSLKINEKYTELLKEIVVYITTRKK